MIKINKKMEENKMSKNKITKKDNAIKWLVSSTGSDTYNTPFTKELTKLMEEVNFKKLHGGNPTFGTDIDYQDKEMDKIAEDIIELRKKHKQDIDKIEVICSKIDKSKKFFYENDDKK